MRKLTLPVAIATVSLLFSCASIIHGPRQKVAISSTPTGAMVSVNGHEIGKTPISAEMSRKEKNNVVKIDMKGYLPYELNFARKTDGWVWGNIVFGGLIGLIVDASNGAMYKLTPEQLHAEMKNQNGSTSSVSKTKDGLCLIISLKVNEDYEKVGQLVNVSASSAE